MAGAAIANVIDFNPRSRMGSDALEDDPERVMNEFQSTLPHGERLWLEMWRNDKCLFQSTLPHGERRDFTYRAHWYTNFNPRSRMGSDANDFEPLED